MVDKAAGIAEKQKARVDPMYHEKIDYLVDLYARKLAENLNQANVIDARVPSIMISGGGNFPNRKKEKQNAARDKNMGEYMHIQGLLDKIRSTGMGGISADDRLSLIHIWTGAHSPPSRPSPMCGCCRTGCASSLAAASPKRWPMRTSTTPWPPRKMCIRDRA